jgi:hypothetical protein
LLLAFRFTIARLFVLWFAARDAFDLVVAEILICKLAAAAFSLVFVVSILLLNIFIGVVWLHIE